MFLSADSVLEIEKVQIMIIIVRTLEHEETFSI